MTAVRPCPSNVLYGIAVTPSIWRQKVLAAATLVLLLPPSPSAAQSSIQSSSQPSSLTSSTSTTTLSGQVINTANGLPVPRALVRFNQRAMLTDREGKFFFDQVTDTSANLQVTKPGYSMTNDPSDPGGLSFQLSQITGPVELRLYPEALLTGTITSPDGTPIAQVSVMARRSTFDESGHRWLPAGQGQTDRHGDFRIPVPAGDYQLETRYVPRSSGTSDAILPIEIPASGSGDTIQAIHLRPGQEQHFDLQPTVRRTYPVSVTVESQGTRGLPSITARTTSGLSFNVPVIQGRGSEQVKDAGNQFRNQATINLPTGTYTLSARTQTRETTEVAETRVTVTGAETGSAETSDAILRFVSTPSIPVELVIDPNATSDNMQSSSTSSNSSTRSSGTSTTSSNTTQIGSSSTTTPSINQFGLTLQRVDTISEGDLSTIPLMAPREGASAFNVLPGTYRLMARTAGRWYIRSASYGAADLASQDIAVTAGAAGATVRIVVSNLTGSLQGTVQLNGVPSASWIYLIADAPSLPQVISIHSSNSGTINDAYVPPGSYRVIAFERRHSVDFTNPDTLARYSSYIQSVTINSGNASSVNLNAVPQLVIDSEAHP